MYFVYIIQSTIDRKFYTGITNNLERRLAEHNKGGSSTPTTAGRGPFELIHHEQAVSMKEAREREIFLKSGAGRRWRNSLYK